MKRYEDTLPTYSYKTTDKKLRVHLRRSKALKFALATIALASIVAFVFIKFYSSPSHPNEAANVFEHTSVIVDEPESVAKQPVPVPEPGPKSLETIEPNNIDPYLNMMSLIGLQLIRPVISDTKSYLLSVLLPAVKTAFSQQVLDGLMGALMSLHKNKTGFVDFLHQSIIPIMESVLRFLFEYSPEMGNKVFHLGMEACDGIGEWIETSNPMLLFDLVSADVAHFVCPLAGLGKVADQFAKDLSRLFYDLLPTPQAVDRVDFHDPESFLSLIPSHDQCSSAAISFVSKLISLKTRASFLTDTPLSEGQPDSNERKSKKSDRKQRRKRVADDRLEKRSEMV